MMAKKNTGEDTNKRRKQENTRIGKNRMLTATKSVRDTALGSREEAANDSEETLTQLKLEGKKGKIRKLLDKTWVET